MLIASKWIKKEYISSTLPNVTIVCAAYNEESVIQEKLESFIKLNYPANRINFLIGDDDSSDKTAAIIQEYNLKDPRIQLKRFGGRNGKPKIIDQLIKSTDSEIIISTDANIIFDENLIHEIVAPFEDSKIGLVDSIIAHTNIKKDGISIQEKNYIQKEALVKNGEGKLFGAMMGPFGACFAFRKELYESVPSNFLVDDFFICMTILSKGYKAISNTSAIVFEDVSNDLKAEVKRKKRIAAGNFQNLFQFKALWLNPLNKSFIPFILHKLLRWVGPILLLLILLTNVILTIETDQKTYSYLLLAQIGFYAAVFIDPILKKIGIHSVFLRYINHFISMNVALFLGLIHFLNGIKTNIWEPTQRNQ